MDINQPVENSDLVAAIERLLENETPETEAAMIAALKEAHFLSPVTITPPPPAPGPEGMVKFPEGTTIGFSLFTGPDGQSILYPAFTDWGELRKWQNDPEQQTLVTRLGDFTGLLSNNNYEGVIVNPCTHRLLLTRERIALLTGKAIPYAVPEGTKYQVGTPAV